MSARNKHGICAYCGRERKLTKDHVPPQLLLEHPFPPNLWTVPACCECNESFRADDEYSRAVLTVDLRANFNSAAQSNLKALARSLQRPDGRGFAEYLAKQTAATRIVTPSGMPIMMIDPDRKRINNTGLHILRGLYFRETGKPLPETATVLIENTTGLTSDHPDMATIVLGWQVCQDHRNGAMGTAFSYSAAFGDGVSFWLTLLYDYFFWSATIDERPWEHENTREHEGQIGRAHV